MVQQFKNAVNRRGERSREALLQRLEGELDGIYDLIYQMCADETHSLSVLERVLRQATKLSKSERYERYLRLWVLGITVDSIRRSYPRFLAERGEGEEVPLESLSLEEKLVLFLHDRSGLSYEEIAGATQIPVGRVGRSLTYAREKVAQEKLGKRWSGAHALRERLGWNRTLEGADASYVEAMSEARHYVSAIPARRFAEIESTVRQQKLMPLLGRNERVRWADLSWRYKLGLEASFLGAFGLFVVVVLPWTLSRVNTTAFVEGRFAEVFQAETPAEATAQLEEISTDRLLAVNNEPGEANSLVTSEPLAQEGDEFAEMDFPSGDSVETGTAPIAPSRQSATVYRLIVQSPSPSELIPHVRTLFAEKNVRERDSSGRVMPGGVYFDGITSVGSYPLILKEMQKLGQTKTYSTGASRNPNERARVIVWVQQI